VSVHTSVNAASTSACATPGICGAFAACSNQPQTAFWELSPCPVGRQSGGWSRKMAFTSTTLPGDLPPENQCASVSGREACGIASDSFDDVSYSRMYTIPRIATVCALLLSFLGPSVVCALPFSQLTSSERDCCRKMQGECGGMKMPASHSCCQRTGPSHVDATQPESRAFHAVISLPAVLPQPALLQPPRIVFGRSAVRSHSPPITSAPAISVLRI
jgi:hypothetical protein